MAESTGKTQITIGDKPLTLQQKFVKLRFFDKVDRR